MGINRSEIMRGIDLHRSEIISGLQKPYPRCS
ncbi:hypothetical protein T4A_3710 [Trichinella pseudospiralis]|uniref:Uncharacterized protein n=1 Tax=Trichinella pseudospiralis TaxID=6337 RepID=A0A0V1DR86_TRIPS|nr:hypothetical protein T4A_3710 [Trichinella pseudospiralis]